tara:strand:+ start:641 stop:745 length:105 start_codon:yes stop_codon:yes gene_type:complete
MNNEDISNKKAAHRWGGRRKTTGNANQNVKVVFT